LLGNIEYADYSDKFEEWWHDKQLDTMLYNNSNYTEIKDLMHHAYAQGRHDGYVRGVRETERRR